MHRAETQSRRENQNQDMVTLSCAKPPYGPGFAILSVLAGQAGYVADFQAERHSHSANKYVFLCSSGALREDNG